ncbi:NADPH-dependent FMN reductase [Maritalea mediterranea]|uniref:NAD(P)H-dependent oxidoreductase n=1 Tax=Maritalea mediterranea TaxID=2909667 RepID=A0ABS9E7R2_9HYPH|nr:NAD(P)H-dependent oxidoreductase [Maritalea mediterranea]MCF4098882.1 NAD(P)H-dependent oxidoreductase [Maritalea mediterranea]
MLKIGIIMSTTRDSRFAEKPAKWILDKANKHDSIEADLIDLRDFDLPFFNEKATNLWAPSEDARAVQWQQKLAKYDGFIFVTAEYNHSIPAVLKNALDQAYLEWVRKPAAFVGYGGVGASRAVEHLRGIVAELQMAPIRETVHIGGGEFMKVSPMGDNQEMSAIDKIIGPKADDLLDDLVWWADALKAAREKSSPKYKAA